jgi:hypothetical protein
MRLRTRLAGRLGHPAGLAGPIVARGLNRGNQRLITTAVRTLQPPPGGRRLPTSALAAASGYDCC